MRRIWIYAPNQEAWIQEKKKIFSEALAREGLEILSEPRDDADLALCMGGDGALLSMIRNLGELRTKIPVSGVHSSPGLGFLHPLAMPQENAQIPELAKKFKGVVERGEFFIQKRWGLACTLLRQRHSKEVLREFWAMNDCVLNKGNLSRMVRVGVEVDGTVLYPLLRGDGLIVSTATGSTAYSFSAGGPVISPELECLLLTPICPHEISNRPILMGPDAVIDIEVLDSRSPCFLTEDGQSGLELQTGQVLRIRKAPDPVRWWIPHSRAFTAKNYYELLRDKLGFGAVP
jgi:NAD+ kinase